MIICFFFALVAVNKEGNSIRTLSRSHESVTWLMIILIIITLTVFVGFRHITGYSIDEYAYRNRFVDAARKPFISYVFKKTEILDALQVWLLSHLFGDSQAYLVGCAAVTYFCFIVVFSKNSENFELAILLIFLLNIVNVGFNTMQQVEASAVAFCALPFLKNRKFLKYTAVILVAALIHNSAIILIPFYFIANMKPWSGKFLAVSSAFVFLMIIFDSILPTMLTTFNLQQYEYSVGTTSVKIITVLVAFLPLLFSFLTRSYYDENDNFMSQCVNTTLIYAMIYLIALRNVYVSRFAIFFQPWIIMYYTKAMTYMRKNNLSTIMYYLLVVGYGATEVYFSMTTEYSFVLFSS